MAWLPTRMQAPRAAAAAAAAVHWLPPLEPSREDGRRTPQWPRDCRRLTYSLLTFELQLTHG